MKTLVILFALILSACGSNAQFPSSNVASATATPTSYALPLVGSVFGASPCFLNKAATQAAGANVYSISAFQFADASGGLIAYENYSDSACTSHVSNTEYFFVYQVTSVEAGVYVVRVQGDSMSAPYAPFDAYWMVMQQGNGYVIDFDFTNGDSAPYASAPTDAQIQAFAATQVAGVSFPYMQPALGE